MKLSFTFITIVFAFTLLLITVLGSMGVSGWSNGGYSSDPSHPDYGTHDWIAQHALDFLPTDEKQFYSANLETYLYGTELPDNAKTFDGVGDTSKHHIYFSLNGSTEDEASAIRAQQEYLNAQNAFGAGNFSAVAEHLGMMTHYISDVSVFGHVMGASTPWGTEQHHSDYENSILAKTSGYNSNLNNYLVFDGNLSLTSAKTAAIAVAKDTTFGSSKGLNCTWMDQNYNWSNPIFADRVGESLNLATNSVADVLHTFYLETVNVTPEFPFSAVTLMALFAACTISAVFYVRKH